MLIRYTRERFNRRQRRAAEKELDKVLEKVYEVENYFLEDLFNPGSPDDYQLIYDFHKENFMRMFRWIMRMHNFRYIEINMNYFINKYGPLERPFNV